MNKIMGHLGDRFPIYLLVFIIGSLMLYYSFGYIPHNQLRLDNYGTRVLANKARTIIDKYKGYDNAVSSAPVSYLSKWFFYLYPNANILHVKNQSEKLGRVYYSNTASPFFDIKITKQDFENKARVDQSLTPAIRDSQSTGEIKSIWKDDRGLSYFIYTPSFSFYNTNKLASPDEKTKYPLLLTKISDFTSNLKENDFFEDMFLVRAHKCQQCNSSEEELTGFGNYILDQSKLGLVEFNLKDSAENASSGIYQETILGKQYKVYYQMIKLRRGVDVYVIGLIPLEVFKTEAKKVSVWFLVFCSLGALLLIFLFPVLKLFLLSRGERLATNDISLGVFSVMLCTCLCFILSVGYYFFWGLETERNRNDIRTLAEKIRKESQTEIDTFYSALKKPKLFQEEKLDLSAISSSITPDDFNEIFLLESETGYMKSIYTKKGKIPNLNLFPVTVAKRDYFNAIRENNDLDYFLQSINSFATGKSEVALSVPIGDKEKNKDVGVLTAPLKSILQACVPSPYQFVLLDDRGDVKFHSGWTQIKSENFLSELENFEVVEAYLENAITDYVDFTYLRRECRGFITPVVKNWSVLVYYEKSGVYNISAQVFIMCLMSLFIIVLFCMAVHLLLRLDRHKPVLLKTTPFLFSWLNPNNFHAKIWWYLFSANLLLLITEGIGLWFLDSFVSSLLLALLTITTSYFVNYYVLRPKPMSKVSLFLMIITSALMMFLLVLDPLKSWWLCLIIVVTVVCVIVNKLKEDGDPKVMPAVVDREKAFVSYRCFMICWLTIIIVGPSIGFLVRHFEHEKLLTTYASLITDVQKLRERANVETLNSRNSVFYSVLDNDTLKPSAERTDRCNTYDSVYYNQFPKFAALNRNNTPLQFNYLPNINGLTISRSGDILQVSAETNMLRMPIPKIERHAKLEKAELNLNRSLGVTFILVIVLGYILWRVLTTLTRKIFYLPKHAAWDTLPPPEVSWGDIKFEFANADKELHLLHGITSNLNGKANGQQTTPKKDWEHEKCILELQKEQDALYTTSWISCSEDEKFFLYDLSEDGVVNRPDDEVLRGLAEKKLIRLYPRLEIVNVSFANFVRSRFKKEDIKKMEDQESKEGRWKQVRVLLIIIILAAFAFLSIAEENFFGRATALIGSITLILPNILNVLGSITKLLTKSPPSA
jgi:hypothetical protein